jgi:hypothetical protein
MDMGMIMGNIIRETGFIHLRQRQATLQILETDQWSQTDMVRIP